MTNTCNFFNVSGNIHECCPKFIHHNNEYIVIYATGSIVHMVSLVTGQNLYVFDEHTSLVTSLHVNVINITDKIEIISTSLDGTLIVWDMLSQKVNFKTKLILSIYDMVKIASSNNHFSDKIENTLSDIRLIVDSVQLSSKEKSRKFDLTEYNLILNKCMKKIASVAYTRRCVGTFHMHKSQISSRFNHLLELGQEGELFTFLVVANGSKLTIAPAEKFMKTSNNSTTTYNTTTNSTNDQHHVSDEDTLPKLVIPIDAEHKYGAVTCLATASNNLIDNSALIVTGHEKGHIIVWHNIAEFYLKNISIEQQQNNKKKHKLSTKNLDVPQCTILHWHAHAVNCISLSIDGSTLYSGGEEGVLVIWHNISSANSGTTKSFYPRLGAPISFIENSSGIISASRVATVPQYGSSIYVALTTTDNCIHVIDTSSMKEVWEVRNLCITSRALTTINKAQPKDNKHTKINTTNVSFNNDNKLGVNRKFANSYHSFLQSDNNWQCQLTIEPRTKCIVCNGYPGQLQAFDCKSQVLSNTYNIADFTRVSKREQNIDIYVPSITHFKFLSHNSLGHLLATVEVWKGLELEAESTVKFWYWSTTANKYRLSAQMNNPHGFASITSLSFIGEGCNPSYVDDVNHKEITCGTSSIDGVVKIWKAIVVSSEDKSSSSNSSYETLFQWTCAYSFNYRDGPASALTFCKDGSLFSVAYDNLISFWDPLSVTVKATLVHSCLLSSSIEYAAFIEPKADYALGGGSGEAYLFTGSKKCIALYNLLTTSLVWTYQIEDFTSYAVATNDYEAIEISNIKQDDSSSKISSTCWIAVACTIANTTNTQEETDSEKYSNTSNELIHNNNIEQSQHSLLLFDLISSVPKISHIVSSRISSIIFNSTSNTNDLNRGLFVITENCEMIYCSMNNTNQSNSIMNNKQSNHINTSNEMLYLKPNHGEKVAVIKNTTLTNTVIPALIIHDAITTVNAQNTEQSYLSNNYNFPKDNLKDIFDEHSEKLPPLALLSGEFFSRFQTTTTHKPLINSNMNLDKNKINSSNSSFSDNIIMKSINNMNTNNHIALNRDKNIIPQSIWDKNFIPYFNNNSSNDNNKKIEKTNAVTNNSITNTNSIQESTNNLVNNMNMNTNNHTVLTTPIVSILTKRSSSTNNNNISTNNNDYTNNTNDSTINSQDSQIKKKKNVRIDPNFYLSPPLNLNNESTTSTTTSSTTTTTKVVSIQDNNSNNTTKLMDNNNMNNVETNKNDKENTTTTIAALPISKNKTKGSSNKTQSLHKSVILEPIDEEKEIIEFKTSSTLSENKQLSQQDNNTLITTSKQIKNKHKKNIESSTKAIESSTTTSTDDVLVRRRTRSNSNMSETTDDSHHSNTSSNSTTTSNSMIRKSNRKTSTMK